jgi:hypothetical protein
MNKVRNEFAHKDDVFDFTSRSVSDKIWGFHKQFTKYYKDGYPSNDLSLIKENLGTEREAFMFLFNDIYLSLDAQDIFSNSEKEVK